MRQNRSGLFLGLILILLGVWMVVTRQVPIVQVWLSHHNIWPIWVLGAGALILFIGLITGAPGMAIPASIVAGIGGILYYQEVTHNYASWSYMWTLIPGFVGVGMILAGLLGDNLARSVSRGLRNLLVSAVLFLIFGTLLGNLSILGKFGMPILLILLGVFVLARNLWRGSKV